jgi:Tfp pilus assembly protein PilN
MRYKYGLLRIENKGTSGFRMGSRIVNAIALQQTGLEWAFLRTGTEKIGLSAPPQIRPLSPGTHPTLKEALLADLPRLADEFRLALKGLSGSITVGIPGSWVFMKIVTLPTPAPDEISGMVELQVDKFAPFPLDALSFSWEILHEADGFSRILMVALKSDLAEALGHCFQSAGFQLDRIDLNLIASLHLIQSVPGQIHSVGRQLVIFREAGQCDLVLLHDGIPAILRTLEGFEGLTDEEVNDEIAREAMNTIASLEAEQGGQLAPISLYYRGSEPLELIATLHQRMGLDVVSAPLENFPPVSYGLGHRTLSPGTLNLAPLSWKSIRNRKAAHRRLVYVGIAAVALWLCAVLTLAGVVIAQRRTQSRAQARLIALNAPAQVVRDLQSRVMGLDQYNDRTHSAIESLREITESLPGGLELKSFTYRKGKSVEIAGHAASVTLVYDFKKSLDESDLFTVIELGRTQPDNTGRESFKMTAKLPGAAE